MVTRSRPPFLAVAIAIAACAAPGCGYRVGGNYAPEVRSIHVPTFTSESFRRGFELQLTEEVQKEIKLRTPYRLAGSLEADTRLIGHIVSVDKRIANQTRFDDPRELEMATAVEVRWEDARTGRVLSERRIALDRGAAQLISNTTFAPETGQSLATATQDAVSQVARQVVGMMEIPW